MLEVDGVHTYYGESYVLQGVTLNAPPGRLTALMGRNGVGKTTLIRSIMGLTPPRRGSVRFRSEDLTGQPTFTIARRGLALVPQGRRIFESLTVQEHLDAAGRRSIDPEWPEERIFELFPPLKDRKSQRAGTLSGGEQSMLAIARALRTEPRCLLMDEPTEGLAPVYVEIVVSVIEELKKDEDLSLLIVLPELPVALAVSDYVYIMKKGEIGFEGSPAELEARPDVQHELIGVG